MKGLHIRSSDDYLQRARCDSTSIDLLASGDGADVILHGIRRGREFYIYPGEHKDVLEFFFIVEGECICYSDASKILTSSSYFYTNDLEEEVRFKAMTNLKLLWFSSRPIFHVANEIMESYKSVVREIEETDNYTYQHSERVRDYSVKIAQEMGLNFDLISCLIDASTLHDIGKIEIPEEILNKPGKLTKEEFECMKTHSYIGYTMIKDKYDETIANIILQHHERLDGLGYPYGLKGEEILLEARIIGVADTYDAMTSDRPYRKGLCPEIAMDELKRLSYIQYDAAVVDAFERVLIKEGILKETTQKRINGF